MGHSFFSGTGWWACSGNSARLWSWVGGRRGNPILFDANTYYAMEGISGDQGARSFICQFPVRRIEWDERALFDVDSPEDIPRLS